MDLAEFDQASELIILCHCGDDAVMEIDGEPLCCDCAEPSWY